MKEMTPGSFNELIAELYSIPIDRHGRHRSNYVYRGADVSSWGLQTSLQRLGEHYAKVEQPLLRNFIKYSVDRELAIQSLLYRLAFAQHHGLPTRVLDWSTAPKVALHFACGDESKYDRDGSIWMVDVVAISKNLPTGLSSNLDAQNAYLFSTEMLSNVNTLAELDELGLKGDFALFFEPPSLDGRIVNQAAVLSIMPSATTELDKYISNIPGACKRIIVPKELKWEIRDKLDQDQVNERMLFPGEDGTARWLKRYYGPDPRVDSSASPTSAFTGPMTGTGT